MTEIWEMSATAISDAVRSKQMSATEVTQAHLDRLDAVNPAINAVVHECPDAALTAAKTVDDQIARGQNPGILCGVPVTIKVNTDQRGYATTNGLKLQKDMIAQQDNPVVTSLTKAGGIVVGRTNTPAFSMRWFTNNDLHGQTLNPRNGALTPGGSSGGASAAVAAGICAIGHGTDIAGSVRYPAYACGLHGLRPSLGRIAAFNTSGGDRYIGAQIMAVSGPIARTIDDIGLALQAMSAPDANDPWFTPSPIDQGGFERRVALAIEPDEMVVADEVRSALQDAARMLQAAGWQVDEVPCPPIRSAARINATLWMAEMQFSADKAIANEAEADSMFVYDHMTRDAGTVTLDSLMKALQTRSGLIREWQMFLAKYPVLLCPVSGMLPFAQQLDVQSQADFETVFEAQLIQRALPTLGLPALSVATQPIGTSPVGVQLIAGRFREDILLAAAGDIENAVGCPGVTDPK